MVATAIVDAQLGDDLKGVFAPVTNIHQREVERCTVITLETVACSEHSGGLEDVRGCDFVEKPLKLTVSELDGIEFLEFFAKVAFQRISRANIGSMPILEAYELFYQFILNIDLPDASRLGRFRLGIFSW